MTPNTLNVSSLGETVKKDVTEAKSWLLAHERLIIFGLLLGFAAFFGDKILTHEAQKDAIAASQAQQALTIQQEQNKTLAAQVAQQQIQYQALASQVASQNAQLAQAVQTRTAALKTQQQAIQTLPVPAVVDRWAQLTGVKPSEMTPTPDGVLITPEAARTTVSQLEEVPVLRANLADTEAQKANLTTQLSAANDLNGKLTEQVKGLTVEIADTKKADAAELKAERAKSRKSKLKLFGLGYVAGFVSGVVVHVL